MKSHVPVALSVCVAASLLAAGQTPVAPQRFTFVSWGDTKSGLNVLSGQARHIKSLNPDLTIYCGDLVTGFSLNALNRWKLSLNAGVGPSLVPRTFAVRGNHDKGDKAGWRISFDFARAASAVGATHYRSLDEDLTYSFDFANAHFVGLDVPGDVTAMTAAQLTWLDDDLARAEGRGVTHAFVFWHGPLYPVGGHCCSASKPEFVSMANRHPVLSAVFNGHEHQIAWVHIDRSRYPQATHQFEQFVTGASGAATKGCMPGRSDFCRKADGFALVSVTGNAFTVTFFLDGKPEPAWTKTFTKGATPSDGRPASASR